MSNELTQTQQGPTQTMQMTPATAMLFDQHMAARAWKAATLYASSDLVPKQFQNRPENVFIMMQLAVRTGQDLFMLLQNCYIVHGRPGFEAKYLIGQLSVSGKIKGVIKFTFDGKPGTDDYGCTAWCIEAETGERIDGPKVDWRMVKGEGWNSPKGGRDGKPAQKSKWETMPDLMFRYRSAAMLIRTTFPDVTMGLQTKEELEDSIIDVTTTGETDQQRRAAVNAFLSSDEPKIGNGDANPTENGNANNAAEKPAETETDRINRERAEANAKEQADPTPAPGLKQEELQTQSATATAGGDSSKADTPALSTFAQQILDEFQATISDKPTQEVKLAARRLQKKAEALRGSGQITAAEEGVLWNAASAATK